MTRLFRTCLFILSAAFVSFSFAAGSSAAAEPSDAAASDLTGWRLPSAIVLQGDFADASRLRQIAGGIEFKTYGSPAGEGEPAPLAKEIVSILAKLDTGRIQIMNRRLSVAGIAGRETIAQLKERIEKLTREGVEIASVQLSPLDQAPFHWAAMRSQRGAGPLQKIELSGFVPGDAARSKLIGMAMGLSTGMAAVDRMTVKEAQPIVGAAAEPAALSQLALLESGFVWIYGDKFDLVGVSRHTEVRDSLQACRALERAMPKGIECKLISISLLHDGDVSLASPSREAARKTQEERRPAEAPASADAERWLAEAREKAAEARAMAEAERRAAEARTQAEAERKGAGQRSSEAGKRSLGQELEAAHLKAERELQEAQRETAEARSRSAFHYGAPRVTAQPDAPSPAAAAGGSAGELRSAYGGYHRAPEEVFKPVASATSIGADLAGDSSDPRIVDILYATSRKQDSTGTPEMAAYSWEHSPSLNFGRARVRIPDDHKTGRLEVPGGISIFGFQLTRETPDQKKHFMLRSCEAMTLEQWDSLVDQLSPSDALIFVHGFNNTFEDSVFRFAQVSWDLQYSGLRVLFSWASKGGMADYIYDRDSALNAREGFLELLDNLARKHGISKVHVIAHSMGNFLVLDALAHSGKPGKPMGQLVMAAPDVDRNQFIDDIPKVRAFFRGMTLYASSNDRALTLSMRAASGMPRAGDVPAGGPVILQGLETIDVSALGEEMFGMNHNTFAEARPLIEDIALLLRDGHPAPRLAGECPMPDAKVPKWWRFAH